ncbi:MAG: AzlC family ABC transporter permease, partial [Pseudomonadota bacterium]
DGILIGIRRLLPICIFVVPFGVAFGVAAVAGGLGPLQATGMSVFVFTATAQFAALEFLRDPVAFVSLGLVALSLSARHIIMGAALSAWVNQLPLGRRLAVLFFLSDANFADTQASMREGSPDLGPLLGGGLALWATWAASTAAGAFGGRIFGDTEAYGFGSLMLCFFAATALGMVRGSHGLIWPVVAASAVSMMTLPLLPTGWNILLAALLGGLISVATHAE